MDDNYNIVVGGIENLSSELHGAAAEVQHFCQGDLDMSGRGTSIFNWENFQNRISKRPNADLTIARITEDKIVKHSADVTAVVNSVVEFLLESLQIIIGAREISSLKSKVEHGFTNLTKSSDGILIWRTVTRENTSWEYSVLFSLNTPNSSDRFVSFLSTFKVEAKCSKTELLRLIKVDSVSNFSVEVKAAKMFVSKDFRSLPREM
ncbi:hypothetical protein BGW42_006956 [Actinomortierella wolfii]|nr:hypothetical protein BGW42_006956 [Actinomortierella wolfii]